VPEVRQPPRLSNLDAIAGAGRGFLAMGCAAAILLTLGACYLVAKGDHDG